MRPAADKGPGSRLRARVGRTAVGCLLAVLLMPAGAAADGDPASDFLLTTNVFYPYNRPVPRTLQRHLTGVVAAAARARFPIKVALIQSPPDLGAISPLFGQPQRYANFLEREIGFGQAEPLLVVMPSGYGVQALPKASMTAARTLPKPGGATIADLVGAATAAVQTLARADNHPLPRSASSAAGTSAAPLTPVLLAALAVAAATAAALILRHRQRTPRP